MTLIFAARKSRRRPRVAASPIDACAATGYRQMIAYIDAGKEPSLRLHEACGFKRVGNLSSVGYKVAHWPDVAMVQRSLGPGNTTPADVWPSVSRAEE